MAGISDNHQRVCLSLSLWNENDAILKERLFGVTGHQGNHGEDVKELYYYLDSTPTHSYMKFLYKYPQKAYPYEELVRENMNRGRDVTEFEILDTDAFDEDRYWDVFLEVRTWQITRIYSTYISNFSTPKTNKILITSTFGLHHIIAVRILPLCTLSLNSGSRTLGPGLNVLSVCQVWSHLQTMSLPPDTQT